MVSDVREVDARTMPSGCVHTTSMFIEMIAVRAFVIRTRYFFFSTFGKLIGCRRGGEIGDDDWAGFPMIPRPAAVRTAFPRRPREGRWAPPPPRPLASDPDGAGGPLR